MGVTGLLPILRSIAKRKHVEEYKGQKVAVDAYCWLHRGAFGCAQDLCEGRETSRFVNYCMTMVKMLLYYEVKPILVFDGANLPLKLSEENTRERSRKEHLERAFSYKKEGNASAALRSFQRAVDVTPNMAKKLIDALEKANIEFLVAPYEADAQMAYLAINNQVEAVITEDSDLLAYGCPKVLYKMNKTGEGEEICLANLPQNTQVKFDGFTHQMFIEMCIMAGCDFLKGLPGIGIKKAHSYISKLSSFLKVITKVKLAGTLVPEDYHLHFQKVIWLFRHQRVFCPKEKRLVHLKSLPKGGIGGADVDVPAAIPEDDDNLDFLGPLFSDEVAFEIAKGRVNPVTKKTFDEEEEYDENASCNIIQCTRPRRKSIRASGLRPLRKTDVTNLYDYFPKKQSISSDEKPSEGKKNLFAEDLSDDTNLVSGKESSDEIKHRSDEEPSNGTKHPSDDKSSNETKPTSNEEQSDEKKDLSDDNSPKERLSDSEKVALSKLSSKCSKTPTMEAGKSGVLEKEGNTSQEDSSANEIECQVRKRPRLQTPMNTEIITGLNHSDKSDSAKHDTLSSKTVSPKSECRAKIPIDSKEYTETQSLKETERRNRSSLVLDAGKEGNSHFHSISHVTYFAKAAKSALTKVQQDIRNKKECEDEVSEETARPHEDKFKDFAFKHMRKKRTFAKI